jgi:hypothetical protein
MVPDINGNATTNQAPIPYGYGVDANGKLKALTNVAQFEQVAGSITKPPTSTLYPPGLTPGPTPSTGIPFGFYAVLDANGKPTGNMKPIPEGYVVGTGGVLVLKSTTDSMGVSSKYFKTDYTLDPGTKTNFVKDSWTNSTPDISKTKYGTDNYNVEYHSDTGAELNDTLSSKGTWVRGKDGQLSYLPWTDISGDITYYQPGAYPYGPSTYVPNYEDSIYLSKSTGLSSVKQFYNVAENAGGFCQQTGENLEFKCNALDTNTCASTSCCVLLGGSKCVKGNQNGPTIKSNYSDLSIRNKDYYYYQGKCYGNCTESNPFFMTNALLATNSKIGGDMVDLVDDVVDFADDVVDLAADIVDTSNIFTYTKPPVATYTNQ